MSVGTLRVHNRTRGTVLATRCRTAGSLLSRGIGLIGRSGLRQGEGLRIPETSAITMFFMRFPIDAVFVDRAGRVVRVAAWLAPWAPMVWARGAAEVIELPAGTARLTGTQAGDVLTFE
jgi:uncharacterized membrane protein (UPF0127 family)